MSEMIGHNQPSFDQIVEENLQRGLYMSQRDALISVIRDPRCEPRHIRVLAEVIARMNVKNGMAYPGRASLARDTQTTPTGQLYEEYGYTARGVGKTIQELTKFGYLVQTQRSPEHGGRAISHYTIARPSVEDLQREITEHIETIRAQGPSKFLQQLLPDTAGHTVAVPPDATYVGVATDDANDTHEGVSSAADDTYVGGATHAGASSRDTPVMEAGDTPVVPTVTSKRTSSKKEGGEIPKPPADAGSTTLENDFELFWAAFPPGRKKHKLDARDLFVKIASGKHKSRKASAIALIDGARRYAATKPDPDYTPLPSTWLNGGCWLDDTPAADNAPWWQDAAKVNALTTSQWRGSITKYAADIWPLDKLGPPPGSPRCVVPAPLVAELRLTEIYDVRGIRRHQ